MYTVERVDRKDATKGYRIVLTMDPEVIATDMPYDIALNIVDILNQQVKLETPKILAPENVLTAEQRKAAQDDINRKLGQVPAGTANPSKSTPFAGVPGCDCQFCREYILKLAGDLYRRETGYINKKSGPVAVLKPALKWTVTPMGMLMHDGCATGSLCNRGMDRIEFILAALNAAGQN